MGSCNLSRRWIATLLVGMVSWAWSSLAPAQDPDADTAPKSSPAALRAFNDAASFQNNGAFDLAAQEWDTFCQKFPKDPLAPDAHHYLGICRMQLKQYDQAATVFQKVVDQYPKFAKLEEVLLNLGRCQYLVGGEGKPESYRQAAETFASLLTRFRRGKYSDQALYFRGEALYALQDRDAAITSYGLLVRDFPDSDLRSDALYALGVTYEEVNKYDQAAKVYELFVKEFPEHELIHEIRMRQAETVLQAGDAVGAEKGFAEAAKVPGFALADHALSRQAFCLAQLDRFEEAAKVYAEIPVRFPESTYAETAAMSAGQCFYRAQRFDEAAAWFGKILEKAGEDAAEAAHWICRIQLRNGQHAEALKQAEAALNKLAIDKFHVDLKMDRADALYAMADRSNDALTAYLEIVEQFPGHALAPQALYYAGFTALEQKDYPQAVALATRFAAQYPDNSFAADAGYVRAESLLQQQQLGDAVQAFQKIIAAHAQHPDHDAWKLRLAFAQYLSKDYPAVLKTLAMPDGLKTVDHQAEAYFLIGASQFGAEAYPEAEAALAKSRDLNQSWLRADEATLYLARTYDKLGRREAAVSLLNSGLESYPNSAVRDRLFYRLGELYYASEQFAEAQAAYAEVTRANPKSAFADFSLYGQGWSLIKLAKYDQAIDCLSQLLANEANEPTATDALFARGIARRLAKQFPDAIQDFRKYVTQETRASNLADAWYELGLAQVGAGQGAEAVKSFETLLNQFADFAHRDRVLYELAWAQKSLGADAQALQRFKQLSSEFPESTHAAEAWFHVGESLYAGKQYVPAAEAYGQAVAGATTLDLQERSHYKLAWSRYQEQEYAGALEAFRKQLELSPKGLFADDARFMSAECLFKQEDFQNAFPAFQALQGNKDYGPQIGELILLHGAQAGIQLEKFAEAIELLETLLKDYPEAVNQLQARYELGWASQKSGKLDDAYQSFEQVAQATRSELGARAGFMMGEVRFEQQRHQDAIKDFQRVMFRFGAEEATEAIKNWQAKSAYEAGRCAEVLVSSANGASQKKMRVDQAKTLYQFVVDKHPEHELAQLSKQRLTVLNKL